MSNDLQALVKASESEFRKIAPKWFSVERLTHLMLSASSRNAALLECTKESFLGFCMKCAETGLEPCGAGGAWPVPFKNKYTNNREVVFIPDWRGLIQLAKKSGQIKHAYGEVVCENDYIEYEKGDMPKLVHKPALSARGKMIGAYCVCVLPDGSKHIEYMNKEEIEGIRKRSKAKDEGPWITDPEQMSIKTVVKRGLKPFATSPEMQTAIQYDNDALGLSSLEQRPPVTMPRELPPAQSAAPKTESAASANPNEVTGTLENVTTKSGTGKKGAWTKYGLLVGAEWYGTFDAEIGKRAETMQGLPVTLTWKQDGNYKTVTAIREAAAESSREVGHDPAADDDDLPFDSETSEDAATELVKQIKAARNDKPKLWKEVCKRFRFDEENGAALETQEIGLLKRLSGAMKNQET